MEVRPGTAADEGDKADAATPRAELKVTIDPIDIRRAPYRLRPFELEDLATQLRTLALASSLR